MCRRLEADFPQWIAFWTVGGLPWTPEPGYRAVLRMHGHHCELYASTAAEIRAQLAAVDAELPRVDFPARFSPLVDPS